MSTEAMKLALDALEYASTGNRRPEVIGPAITAIKEALAQPEQEYICSTGLCHYKAQPEQEPVAFINVEQRKLDWAKYTTWDTPTVVNLPKIPLYTTPPQRKPLTDEELRVIENKINPNMRWRSSDEEGITFYPIEYYELVRAIEAAHGIKETT